MKDLRDSITGDEASMSKMPAADGPAEDEPEAPLADRRPRGMLLLLAPPAPEAAAGRRDPHPHLHPGA